MRFDEFIVVDSINPNLQATKKDDAIREMVRSLVKAGKLSEDDFDSVVRAERRWSRDRRAALVAALRFLIPSTQASKVWLAP